MYHFFVEPEQIFSREALILGKDVNHVKNVLRMQPGEQVTLSDGQGGEYLCEIRELTPEQIRLSILERRKGERELPSSLVLYQCLPKADKMELIIQKAVELGAARIVPVASRRCVVKLDGKKAESKRRRWQEIAKGAAQQSGRSLVPPVEPLMSLQEALRDAESLDHRWIPYENARGMEGSRELLGQIRKGQSAGIFIGPEGGFEESEIAAAREAGVHPVTLGKRILRTETAGLCILSVLMFHLEE